MLATSNNIMRIRMRMLQRGQSQHPKTPSHHMLSGTDGTTFADSKQQGKYKK